MIEATYPVCTTVEHYFTICNNYFWYYTNTKLDSDTFPFHLSKNRIPPRLLTTPFIPLTQDNGFHQRLIQLDYVDQSLLVNYPHIDPIDLQRLRVEFTVNNHGDMKFKRMIGEKKRSVIDILGVHG